MRTPLCFFGPAASALVFASSHVHRKELCQGGLPPRLNLQGRGAEMMLWCLGAKTLPLELVGAEPEQCNCQVSRSWHNAKCSAQESHKTLVTGNAYGGTFEEGEVVSVESRETEATAACCLMFSACTVFW